MTEVVHGTHETKGVATDKSEGLVMHENAPETCMDKNNPPLTFGVFKPVGHTVMAFQSDTDLQAAVHALAEHGFSSATWVRYAPDEMSALVDVELQDASPLAAFGYELDLAKVHRILAEQGCSFLVVHAPGKEQAERVADIARTMKAVAAQHYGTFVIEDVVEFTPGPAPVP
ncbi:MAG: hypothetical protein A3F78_14745 [Burkholderiales bacterium RIFCSPLOWO2_12_FULL_61_40]|nr:MAG: hypothetical protein A3F78_14745 [Burkholderiales bacterium RIFCSPLOWO2_12_FULL_61_40]